MHAHWVFENQLYMSVLNCFILFDSFIYTWERVPNLRPRESERFDSISSASDLRNIEHMITEYDNNCRRIPSKEYK